MSVALYLLSTVGGYVLTSALLLKCPTLLHKKKQQQFRCKHISHRGVLSRAVEFESRVGSNFWVTGVGVSENVPIPTPNRVKLCRRKFGEYNGSLSACCNLGTDMLELDCHLTKDEQVVVSHDGNLKRSTGVNVNISDLTYCDLPPYLCKLDVTFEKECCCEGGEDKCIPLLREVFEAFPCTPINIDIKDNNDILIKKVSELITAFKREHLTVWGNSNQEIVEKCHRENTKIPLLFSLQRVLLLVGLFYTGLLPFIPLREQFLEIPMPLIIMKLKEPEKMSKSQRFVIWLADKLLMRKALFDHLIATRHSGMVWCIVLGEGNVYEAHKVYIWVLNEEEEYKRAFDLGATGVMTDYPTKLKEFLEKYST